MNTSTMTPEQVIQMQLDAYNARDLEALLRIYADDAQMFEHPAKLLATGSEELRERFMTRFKESNLNAKLRRRIVMGNTVIDHEEVSRAFPEGTAAPMRPGSGFAFQGADNELLDLLSC